MPHRNAETSLKEEVDNDQDTDYELNELNEEVKQSGFVSHRALKQLAHGERGEEEGAGEKVSADTDAAYKSISRSEYDAKARNDDSFDHNDLEVLNTDTDGACGAMCVCVCGCGYLRTFI